jgi:hypothetical protein
VRTVLVAEVGVAGPGEQQLASGAEGDGVAVVGDQQPLVALGVIRSVNASVNALPAPSNKRARTSYTLHSSFSAWFQATQMRSLPSLATATVAPLWW